MVKQATTHLPVILVIEGYACDGEKPFQPLHLVVVAY